MRTVALTILSFFALVSSQASAQSGLATRVAELEAQVEALTNAVHEAREILQFVRIEGDSINGLAGPHWIIEGANVHIQSGAGETDDGCNPRLPCTPTGLGNLIVGYNESVRLAEPLEDRTGSHNLVVGQWHSYSSFAGFVVGIGNQVLSRYASVCGGNENVARGIGSSVSGGTANEAIGNFSSVSGGANRTALNDFNWAAGSLLEPN